MTARNGACCEDPGKRQAILEQAIRTFAELGYRGADVQVIADRAGVGKGTVYRYFRSKEDLFWATAYEVMVRLDRHIFEAADGADGASDKLQAVAAAYANFYSANPPYLELAVQERAEFRGTGPQSHREYHQMMMQKMGEILQQGIDAGQLRPVNTQQTTLALGCLLYGATVLGCYVESVDVTQMTQCAVDIFLRGIRNESSPIAESADLIGSQTP
jgi:AcrR family transcriptional regulator